MIYFLIRVKLSNKPSKKTHICVPYFKKRIRYLIRGLLNKYSDFTSLIRQFKI